MRADATFHHLLGNNLVANITNFTVWFAVTFWVFLETQSVFATGMIAASPLTAFIIGPLAQFLFIPSNSQAQPA
jgi:hypothetical protein